MSTSVCWELTCDGLVSHPGEVKDSHPLNTTETGDKRRFNLSEITLFFIENKFNKNSEAQISSEKQEQNSRTTRGWTDTNVKIKKKKN